MITGNGLVYVVPKPSTAGITPYRSLVRYTAPTVEPVSLAEAKAHCRVDIDADDALIAGLIQAARTYCEDVLDISMITTVWEARYDAFPLWEVILPRAPMQASTVTVTYRDEAGATHTLSSASSQFQVDANVTPGRIYPLYNGVWPAVRGDENSVVVRWSAGYGTSGESVPATLKHLIMLLVAHWYASREPIAIGNLQVASVPMTFETLLAASQWGGYR